MLYCSLALFGQPGAQMISERDDEYIFFSQPSRKPLLKRTYKMNIFNFNNKKFRLIQNSENGQVNVDTVFEYKQDNNLVTADYYGGTIKYGKIIADLQDDKLNMLYQCLTTDNELKAGKAVAQISLTDEGKMKLTLNWEWLTNPHNKGTSEYVEIE